jgi:hypothetical protein
MRHEGASRLYHLPGRLLRSFLQVTQDLTASALAPTTTSAPDCEPPNARIFPLRLLLWRLRASLPARIVTPSQHML